MFNLITINLKYSYSFMYPVNVFQTSINNFIVLVYDGRTDVIWTIKQIALKFHSITNNISHILKRLHIQCCIIKQGHRWVCVL